MPLRRRFALLSPLLLLACTACGGNAGLLPVRSKPSAAPPTKQHTQFATVGMPRLPGETISLNPVLTAETLGYPTDPTDPPGVATVVANPDPTPPETLPSLDPLHSPSPLAMAIQAFADGKPDKAVDHLAAFDKPNQELLLQLIPALVQASKIDLSRTDGEEPQALARQFESATAALAKRAGLGIARAAICLAVDGYGLYTPVKDKSALLRDSRYSLYVEIGNVPSLPGVRKEDGAEGFWTVLDCEMRVADDQGGVVEIVDVTTKQPGPSSKKTKTEFTRSPVRDYYVAAVLKTPARPGAYNVTFEVRDPRTGQKVSKTVGFRVQ